MDELIVGESEGNAVDIGPAIAVLGSARASVKAVAKAIRELRLDLYERDQGTAGWALIDAVPHLVKLLKGKATTHAKRAILDLFAEIHPSSQEVDSPDDDTLRKKLAAAKPLAKSASKDHALASAAKRFLNVWTSEPRPSAPVTTQPITSLRRLDDKLEKAILQVIASARPYAPDKLVASLASLGAGERVDLVMDLIDGRSGFQVHWTFGPDLDIPVGERRRARVYDLSLRLLADADPIKIDAEIAALVAAEAKLGKNVNPDSHLRRPLREPRALLALARARRAGGKVPTHVLAQLDHVWGCGTWFRDICSPALVKRFSKQAIGRYTDTLLWLTDLSPQAAAAVARAGLTAADRPNIVDEL